MAGNRIDKISEEVKREVGRIIQTDVKDPRLPMMVSVTHAKVTKDLKYATIYVSVLGDNDEKKNLNYEYFKVYTRIENWRNSFKYRSSRFNRYKGYFILLYLFFEKL